MVDVVQSCVAAHGQFNFYVNQLHSFHQGPRQCHFNVPWLCCDSVSGRWRGAEPENEALQAKEDALAASDRCIFASSCLWNSYPATWSRERAADCAAVVA